MYSKSRLDKLADKKKAYSLFLFGWLVLGIHRGIYGFFQHSPEGDQISFSHVSKAACVNTYL